MILPLQGLTLPSFNHPEYCSAHKLRAVLGLYSDADMLF